MSDLNLRSRLLLFFLVVSGFTDLVCQVSPANQSPKGTAILKGRILRESDLTGLEFVTVTLLKPGNPRPVVAGITDVNGGFLMQNLAAGSFVLELKLLGFEKLILDSVALADGQTKDLGDVVFRMGTRNLNEVVIEAQEDFFENKFDKKVFNVEKNGLAAGGTAEDALRQVPAVLVDADGSISMRGSGNVMVLIDGRISGLTGADRNALFNQIPASSIQSIEVITNPSAKYDPDGMSGIINIILKKEKREGVNGSLSITAGSREKYNGNAAINYRKGKFNLYGNYSYRNDYRYGFGTFARSVKDSIGTTRLNQVFNNRENSVNQVIKGGIDYNLKERETLFLVATFSDNSEDEREQFAAREYREGAFPFTYFKRNNILEGKATNLDLAAGWKKSFGMKGPNGSIDASWSNNLTQDSAFFRQMFPIQTLQNDLPELQGNKRVNRFNLLSVQSDWDATVFKTFQWEGGAKAIIRTIDKSIRSFSQFDSTSDWIEDTLISNSFLYDERIFSAYSTIAGKSGRWNWKAGLRAEQTFSTSKLINTGQEFKRMYFNFFPSGYLSRKWNEKTDVTLNYSRRVNRPGVQQLIPFPDYTNPFVFRIGNPFLLPEFVHSLELTLSGTHLPGFTYTYTIYERYTSGLISRLIQVLPTGVSQVTFQNFGFSNAWGFEGIYKISLGKNINTTLNFNVFRTQINGNNGETELNNSNFSGFGKLQFSALLFKDFTLQIGGNYRAPNILAQGQTIAVYSMDGSVRWDFFNRAWSLSLSYADWFDSIYFGVETSGPEFRQKVRRKRETLVGNATLSYRFGRNDQQQKQKKRDQQDFKNDEGGF